MPSAAWATSKPSWKSNFRNVTPASVPGTVVYTTLSSPPPSGLFCTVTPATVLFDHLEL